MEPSVSCGDDVIGMCFPDEWLWVGGIVFFKKTDAAEQERPGVAARRLAWLESQPDLDPRRLVFIDETGASTKMARLRGRSKRGQRCRAAVPHGHWKTTTFTAGLRRDGLTAPMLLDGPMNGVAFLAYEAIDGGLEIDEGMEDTVLEPAPREFGKEALDGIEGCESRMAVMSVCGLVR